MKINWKKIIPWDGQLKSVCQKLLPIVRGLGQKFVYIVLLMVFAFKRKETPNWAKHIIVGALGYLLTPIDAIPDLTPILGYTDDLGVLSFGIVTIASYINDDVRIEARRKLKSLFGELNFEELEQIDVKL